MALGEHVCGFFIARRGAVCLAFGMALVLAPNLAFAQVEPSGGYYFSANVNGSFSDFDDYGSGFDPAVGGGGRIGARALGSHYFAAELQYEWSGEFDNSPVDVEHHVGTANVRYYPYPWMVEPYALAGIGFARVRASGLRTTLPGSSGSTETDTGFAARFGGGVQVHVLPMLSVGVESSYVLGTGDVDGMNYVSVQGLVTLHYSTED